MVFLWVLVFIASLAGMVAGADMLLYRAEKIGRAIGFSPFIVGVTLVGVGTSLPELASSLTAVWQGATEIVVANAIGSNVANILLVVGIAAVIAKRLTVTTNLIDLDLPLLAASTLLVLGIVADGGVSTREALLLVAAYVIYFCYTIVHVGDTGVSAPATAERIAVGDIVFLLLGIAGLALGAWYVVDAVIVLAELFGIETGVIAITAVAFGTSLPELLVSARAAMQQRWEVALGNIFGSNIFNGLVVIGVPGLFGALALDVQTLAIGVPALAAATFLFIISGISRTIHVWEGLFYIVLYALFIGKLF